MSRIVYTAPVEPYVYDNLVLAVDYDWPQWSPAILYHWIVAAPDVYAAVELEDGTVFAVPKSKEDYMHSGIADRIVAALKGRP